MGFGQRQPPFEVVLGGDTTKLKTVKQYNWLRETAWLAQADNQFVVIAASHGSCAERGRCVGVPEC